MKKGFIALGVAFLLFTGILLYNAMNFRNRQCIPQPFSPVLFSKPYLMEGLSRAIRFPTVGTDTASFRNFTDFLQARFTKVFASLEIISDGKNADYILLHWKGKKETTLPVLLMGHMDVVPVDSPELWEHPPFAGVQDEDFIHGRGALDDKCGVMGMLESVEFLLSKNYRPNRGIYFMFGMDEESGGRNGAGKAATWFKQKGIRFESILDEGGSLLRNVVPGTNETVALIGISEKGSAAFELEVLGENGHASMPPVETAAGILSSGLARLEKSHMAPTLTPVTLSMFDFLGSSLDFSQRLAFGSPWFFKSMIIKKMKEKNSTRAAIQTTFAITMLRAGEKDNVLPVSAKAVVNSRILPGTSIQEAENFLIQALKDERIKVKRLAPCYEPSPVSDTSGTAFHLLQQTITNVFPNALTAPYGLIAATDTRHFHDLSDNIFRFLPIYLEPNDLPRIHGTNERILKKNYFDLVQFYTLYIPVAGN